MITIPSIKSWIKTEDEKHDIRYMCESVSMNKKRRVYMECVVQRFYFRPLTCLSPIEGTVSASRDRRTQMQIQTLNDDWP